MLSAETKFALKCFLRSVVCSTLVSICLGQSTELYASYSFSESTEDCPVCCVETARELDVELMTVTGNLRKSRATMAALKVELMSNVSSVLVKINDLKFQIQNSNSMNSSQNVLRGPQGFTGGTGVTGFPGAIGSTGSTGPAGIFGTVGFTGYTGVVGPRGITGSSGGVGPVGDTGYPGYAGPAGPMGFPGAPGYPGAVGYTGSVGATGATGPQGGSPAGKRRRRDDEIYKHQSNMHTAHKSRPRRDLHDDIQSLNNFIYNLDNSRGCSVRCVSNYSNSVQTEIDLLRRQLDDELTLIQVLKKSRDDVQRFLLQVTQQWLDNYNHVLLERYRGPPGPVGATGLMGRTGAFGSTGYQGYQGSPGSIGMTGSTGPMGGTGATGFAPMGSTGLPGLAGYPGLSGITGYPGQQGSTGSTGSTGATGQTGAIGPPA